MNDQQIHDRIEQLIAEEQELRSREEASGAKPDDRKRMEDLEVQLDRAWDLLRQRRAREEAGQDPNLASERPAEIVERYQQ